MKKRLALPYLVRAISALIFAPFGGGILIYASFYAEDSKTVIGCIVGGIVVLFLFIIIGLLSFKKYQKVKKYLNSQDNNL